MTPMPDTMRLDSSPYQRVRGLILKNAGDGAGSIRLPLHEKDLRRDESDWLHGRLTSALVTK